MLILCLQIKTNNMDTLHFPFKSQRITRLGELDEYFDEYRKDKADEAILESFYNAFAANDFDVDAFMEEGSYNLITDRVLRYELLKRILNVAPISEFFPGRVGKVKSGKFAELFGDTLYLLDTCGDFFSNPDGSNSWVESLDEGTRKELKALNIDEDDYVSNLGRHLDEETILYLYQCNSEYNLWRLFASGMGNIKEMFLYYYRDNEEKAKQFLKCVYDDAKYLSIFSALEKEDGQSEMDIALRRVKKLHGDLTKIKFQVESIFLNEVYPIADDDFFTHDNYELALEAWKMNIPAIRKEFVRNKASLDILKRILNETHSDSQSDLL